jgi:flavin-dependent dehydrogenase
MLPMSLPLFEQLGVGDQVKAVSVHKSGAEFYDTVGTRAPTRFYFRNALDKNHPNAYQVRRDQLDEILLRNCEKAGAQVLEETRVRKVELDEHNGSQLTVQNKDGETQQWSARYVVDASGRDTMLANKQGFKRKNLRHGSAALVGHFKKVNRQEGGDAGLISVCWFEYGWVWMIPLPDGVMSIGAVCDPDYLRSRKTSPEEFLQKTLQLTSPAVRERIKDAELITAVSATGNYSYECDEMCLPGAVLVGDAYGFVDPVFSSGVLLGIRSALRGADYVDAVLNSCPSVVEKKATLENLTRRSIKDFSWMINRFNSPSIQLLFMYPANPLRVQEAVISLLAGDVDRDNGVRPRLRVFQVIYYLYALIQPFATIREWKKRKQRAHVEFSGGTAESDAT